ncbi:MAG: hypothetical protein MGF17_05765 [Trichodesmium sp. MAG_R04]|nr:hypothetical protein [Trichodesmium sp. MAG_R04]
MSLILMKSPLYGHEFPHGHEKNNNVVDNIIVLNANQLFSLLGKGLDL